MEQELVELVEKTLKKKKDTTIVEKKDKTRKSKQNGDGWRAMTKKENDNVKE